MVKHTPGPWHASHAYGDGTAIWIAPEIGPKMVLQGAQCIRSDSVKLEFIGVRQLSVNAWLAAAAPELLDAITAMVACFESRSDSATDDAVLETARAAIAKSMGGAV